MGRKKRGYGEDGGGASDIEAKRARARSALQSYETQPLDDRPMIAHATDGHRSRNMENWKSYFTEVMQIDPDGIWIDLCSGLEEAKNYCRVFLNSYVEDSKQRFVVLGPEEYEYRRTVNSASSVTQCWRELIAQADATVLRDKRREDPANYNKWRLRFLDHTHQRGQGPVFEISRWIFHTLAKELGLATTLTFDKIEATKDDTIVFLHTLWEKAKDIPGEPDTRISFHGVILLEAMGGFRRSTILRVTYRDVCLAVVRDPNDKSKKKLVVTPTIWKNKLRRASRVSRAVSISFSMTVVPYSLVCLASLIAARAIKDNAFDPGFESVEALLSRPELEYVDYLPLKWKEEMLDRPIFQISSGTLSAMWHRTWLVSGCRFDPRFYTMRVGTGARLDGVLTDALRNYILSNTTQVFQGSYQTKRVRENLLELAFGPEATGRNDKLFQSLRNMSLSRDAGAPIDPSIEDLQSFEERNDVRGLRADLESARQANDSKEIRSIKSQLDKLIDTLSDLVVQEKRANYFDNVDSLRAQGLSTMELAISCDMKKDSSRKRYTGGAEAVALFLQGCDQIHDEYSMALRSRRYMELLVDYLSRRLLSSSHFGPKMVNTSDRATDDVETISSPIVKIPKARQCGKESRCLLGCGSFRSRSELTKHYQRIHVRNGTFDRPFLCPECLQQGLGDFSIQGGAPAWSNHVETNHGKAHAPNLPSYAIPVKDSIQCLLCEEFYMEGGGLWRHVMRTHARKEGLFQQPFPCPECCRQGNKDIVIDGSDAWRDHLASVHSKAEPLSASPHRIHSPESSSVQQSKDDSVQGKRKRVNKEMVFDFEVRNDSDVSNDLSDDAMLDTADTTPDAATNAGSGTHTPASSVDSELIGRIDPRLLPDQNCKRIQSAQWDCAEGSNHDQILSLQTINSSPMNTVQETCQTHDISYINIPSKSRNSSRVELPSLDADLIEPTSLLTDGSIRHCPITTSEPAQEGTETTRSPQPKETKMLEFAPIDHTNDSPHASSNENVQSDPYKDALLVYPQVEADTTQQSTPVEMGVESTQNPEMTAEARDPTSEIAKLWGRGYALASEGSELDRHTNNAQRRDEISSNVSLEHVIKGKRLRTPKNMSHLQNV